MKRAVALMALALSAGVYLLFASARGALGFPLDDAWIHQVYARNLATRGELAFFAGQPSAGSTSPLWTILLSPGYLLPVDFRAWTLFLGIGLLGASALVTAYLAHRLFPRVLLPFYFCLFTLFEWHLVWSAVSGMEILLFIFLSLLLLERFYARERAWLIGLLAGLLTLTRPEGIVLAALISLGMAFDRDTQSTIRNTQYVLRTAYCVSVLVLVVLPYLAFNWMASGALLPNTFYAKSAEYAELFARAPFVVRWLELLLVPFVGAQILLLPGLIYGVIALARERAWRALIPVAWMLLLPMLYALRLPVAYQHGRYEMPIIPFIVVYGIWGTSLLLARIKNFVVRATWTLATVATLIAFWLLGAAQYATDVAIIDCEMVQTARWVAMHAREETVIAAHDIGALGYFYPRPFIDLAGLVSPEVIPFIRDENRLREYLFSRQATWVIVFPGWYPSFDADSRFVPVYRTDCAVTRAAGEKNMVVYEIRLTASR
jgi:hypothetical protein